jgi:hypothetical protein
VTGQSNWLTAKKKEKKKKDLKLWGTSSN